MKYFLKFLLTAFLISVASSAMAQVTLRGKIVDNENGEPLMRSTVMVMTPDSTKMVTGGTTNEDGSFAIKNLKMGTYVIKVSYIGYHNLFKRITISQSSGINVTVGTVKLVPGTIELAQAVVTAQLQEVEVKDDTLIYNADAFKLPEGSVLEDLVKKLPGVEVEDGTIKVNGKTVKRILVEGKEYFGNDQNMAMKNLPSEIIQKIKTYDRQSDNARITGIDDGNEETVMDLTIRKGFKNGWNGNFNAGYGTEKKYQERAEVRSFRDNYQTTITGNIGNAGDRGGGNGNNTNGQLGARLMYGSKEKLEVGGNLIYNYRKSDTRTKTSSENWLNTTSTFNNSRNQNINKNNSGSGNFKLEWKIDSVTTLLFQPSFNLGKTKSNSSNMSAQFNDDPYQNGVRNPLDELDKISHDIKINENASTNWSDGDSYSWQGNMTLNRRLKGAPWFGDNTPTGFAGRNVSLRLNGATSGNGSKSWSQSNVIYYQRNDSTDLTFRLRDNPSDNKSYSIGGSWNEPIFRNIDKNQQLYLQLNYTYSYQKRHSDGNTYDFAEIDAIGKDIWNYYQMHGQFPDTMDIKNFRSNRLSRYSDNINKTHNIDLQLRYITQLLNATVGLRIEEQNQKMVYQYQGLDTIASRNFSRISPTANVRFRFSNRHTLNFSYRGNSQQPNMTDLFNLTDNSNPLNIREGNPDLKPSFTNNFSADYNRYFDATKQSINGRISYSNTLNSIENKTEYNPETGGQRSQPVNINGDWNASAEAGFNTPLGWDKLTTSMRVSYNFRNNVGYIYQNKQTLKNTVKNNGINSNLSITMRLENIDVRANGRFNWQKTNNELVPTSNSSYYNFSYGLSSTGNFPFGFGYNTDINMSSRRGYSSAEMNTNELIWNAQVSYRFLRKKNMTATLQVYDILNQRSNISRSISAYSRRDTENNSVHSYFMGTLIYRFNTFGSRQARQNLRQQRMESGYYERPDAGASRGERNEGGQRGEGGGQRGGNGGGQRGGNGGAGGFGGGRM